MWIADPNLGIITNIGASHLEKLGSVDGVFKRQEFAVSSCMQNEGVFFVNTGDNYLSTLNIESANTINYSREKGPFGLLTYVLDPKRPNYLSLQLVEKEDVLPILYTNVWKI